MMSYTQAKCLAKKQKNKNKNKNKNKKQNKTEKHGETTQIANDV